MAGSRLSAMDVLSQVWTHASLPAQVLSNTIRAGHIQLPRDPAQHGQSLRSSFPITAAAQGTIAACTLAHKLYEALLELQSQKLDRSAVERRLAEMVLDPISVDAKHSVLEYTGWTRVYSPQLEQGAEVDAERSISSMLKVALPPSSAEAKSMLGIPPDAVAEWDSIAGVYRAKPLKGSSVPGFVRIHTNFPHHKLGVLKILGLAKPELQNDDSSVPELFSKVTREDVQRELKNWDAREFEREAQSQGLCVTAYRSDAEWDQSDMGKAVKDWVAENRGSPFRISRIQSTTTSTYKSGNFPAQTQSQNRPLRVVEMSRVLAMPTATRTLASHGAQVLLLSSPDLPNLPILELHTTRGKHTAYVSLEKDRQQLPPQLEKLLEGADVFAQAYRPEGLFERGLTPEKLQALRPGIIYAELRAFGFTGPWSKVRAFDSLVQTACGLNYLESLSYEQFRGESGKENDVSPKALPVQALDYTSGFLTAFGVLTCKCLALIEQLYDDGKSAKVEDGWHLQVSLASTAEWIKSLGRIEGREAWQDPPDNVVPSDTEELARYAGKYPVRGLKKNGSSAPSEETVQVIAIRHAGSATAQDGTLPGHLGVDQMDWW